MKQALAPKEIKPVQKAKKSRPVSSKSKALVNEDEKDEELAEEEPSESEPIAEVLRRKSTKKSDAIAVE